MGNLNKGEIKQQTQWNDKKIAVLREWKQKKNDLETKIKKMTGKKLKKLIKKMVVT